MRVRLAHCSLQSAKSDERFEALRVTRAFATGTHKGPGILEHAAVECGGELKAGAVCARCPHLLNAVPDVDGKSVTVRCMFLENDRVADVMLPAEHVASVDVGESVAAAAERASHRSAAKLLVTVEGEAIGLLDARLLRGARVASVARLTRWPIPVVPITMLLGRVAQVLRDTGLDFLVVLDHDQLAGTISRPALLDLGVPGL